VLPLVLSLLLLAVSAVQATHNPTVDQILLVAVEAGMSCGGDATQQNCDALDFDGTWHMRANIRPGTGTAPLASLYAAAAVSPFYTPLTTNGTFFLGWLRDMHVAACGPDRTTAATVGNFVLGVGGLTGAGSVSPSTIAGECTLTGGLNIIPNGTLPPVYEYWVNAVVFVPPTPTPPPPTPRPTASPTPTPTASPTPSPTPSPSPTPTHSPTPSPTPNGTASEDESPTPEGTVGGIVFTPPPSAPPDGAPVEDDWASSVHDPSGVSTDPMALASSALLAFLLLVVMGFIGELFNNTVKTNYDVIAGWWSKSRLGRLASSWSNLWKGEQ
jgi:hypothetical protein